MLMVIDVVDIINHIIASYIRWARESVGSLILLMWDTKSWNFTLIDCFSFEEYVK
jgi:hypothetical protein